MKLSICTISFRHHLISIEQVARWAKDERFDGIELWGAHAKNLGTESRYGAAWLADYGLVVSMLSDYLPLDATEQELRSAVARLTRLARRWGTKKLRTFAGRAASSQVAAADRRRLTARLRLACDLAGDAELDLLVELHPNTLADTAASTAQLLSEVAHPALGINFDVLHVWEAGEEPSDVLQLLRPFVRHFHLKNIAHRSQLEVFSPSNVYAASGSRVGMVPLLQGAFDYRTFLGQLISNPELEASLEWFGDDVQSTLARDRAALHELRQLPAARADEDPVTRHQPPRTLQREDKFVPSGTGKRVSAPRDA